MKKADVQIGRTYTAKVSGQLAPVRINSVSPYGGWNATNLSTGRVIRIKTAARLRPPPPQTPGEGSKTDAAKLDGKPGPKSMSELFRF
jgi:hypothetical protein